MRSPPSSRLTPLSCSHAEPTTPGNCREACRAGAICIPTPHPPHTQAHVDFLFIYLKQTSVRYVQVRLLGGWAGRVPSWVGEQWQLKGVGRGLILAWPVWPASPLLLPSPLPCGSPSVMSSQHETRVRKPLPIAKQISACRWDLTHPHSALGMRQPTSKLDVREKPVQEARSRPGQERGGWYLKSRVTPVALGVAGRAGQGQR